MKAVVIHGPGGYRALKLEERPDPVPANGEVLVHTRMAGVNYADCVVRMGLYESAAAYVGWPITPGFEFSGTVAAVGPGVTAWRVGDEVSGVTRFGGYATHVVAPTHQLWRRPADWSDAQAAGFPAAFLTAYYALHVLGAAAAGDQVLVHSAAGGVGGALLQLCHAHGVRAVGVVGRKDKVEVARSLGASEVLCREDGPWWEEARALARDGYQLVLDASGHATLKKGYDLLRPTGRIVVYGFHSMLSTSGGWPNPLSLAWGWLRLPRFNPLHMTGANKSVMAFNLSYLFEHADPLLKAAAVLDQLRQDGKIRPLPVKTFPMSAVADAQRALESGATVGKLVLETAL